MTRGGSRTTMTVSLQNIGAPGSITVTVDASSQRRCLEIRPDGYGDFGTAEGSGCPVYLEYDHGHLRVVAFPDINSETPTIIDLTGAKEAARRSADTPPPTWKKLPDSPGVWIVVTGDDNTVVKQLHGNDWARLVMPTWKRAYGPVPQPV